MTNYQIQSYGMSLSFKTCVVAEIWQPLHNMNYIDRFVYFFTRKRNSSGLLLYPSIQLIKTWRWKRSSVAWIQTLIHGCLDWRCTDHCFINKTPTNLRNTLSSPKTSLCALLGIQCDVWAKIHLWTFLHHLENIGYMYLSIFG